MTNYERMEAGLLYDSCDETIINEQQIYSKALKAFNELDSHDFDKKTQYMKEVFAECGNNNCIETPFRANWGGHHIHFGSGIYVNFNLTAVDDGHIYVGDNVIIVGSPARVLREIGEHDREYFFKDERVDYVNLEEPLFLKYYS